MTESDYPPEMRLLVARFAPGWPPILDVNPGWYPLLARLDARLSTITPNYVLQQCKSKFGALSYYADPSDDPAEYNDEFNETIRAAEWESAMTCEECGALADRYVIGVWVWTLCTEHLEVKPRTVSGSAPSAPHFPSKTPRQPASLGYIRKHPVQLTSRSLHG